MPHSPEVTATALSAFLRGIERRAQVFALAQCGDPGTALAAVRATVQAFGLQAGEMPIGVWPAQFWTLLVQRPELALGGSDQPELAALSHGPRAALLLRLVAGLDFAHGAQVLAVTEPTYRFALQRGLDQLHAAGYDMPALESLRESLRVRVQASGETAVEASVAPPLPAASEVVHRASSSRAWWPLAAGAALLTLSFLPPVDRWLQARLVPPELLAAGTPLLTPTVASDIVTHPDLDLLLAPADEALAQDLAFLAWYEAGAPLPGDPVGAANFALPMPPPAVSAAFAELPDAVRATLTPIAGLWPQLGATARRRLLAHAREWQALGAPEREALRLRVHQWDAQPAGVRARRRAVFAAWHWLTAAERAALRESARRFVALPAPQQLPLRQGFDALPYDLRASWAQGPILGRSLPALAPLFEFVPADERDALLVVVRVLSPELRAVLADRIAAMPQAERGRLRRKLIATPSSGYAAAIRGDAAR